MIVEMPPDNAHPVISADELEDGMTVSEKSISFNTEAIDEVDGEATSSVMVNGETIDIQSDGLFEVQLEEGTNQMVFMFQVSITILPTRFPLFSPLLCLV
ncbi:hypothetical protein [Virgibacillus sp. YIM 98842]|uniref:hypothetical protein n=1 Tax=Virgibacillus sp. YIM 98842 TaxID=2663533 RepID=UPI0013DA7878|nr:hypothetical protein [Virgibacillus sp. YIM 98842]